MSLPDIMDNIETVAIRANKNSFGKILMHKILFTFYENV